MGSIAYEINNSMVPNTCSHGLTRAMGSPVVLLNQIEKVLREQPEQIQWSEVRQINLARGRSGLGLKIHTIQGKEESFTVVTKVKEDCHITQGNLNLFDRIVAINCYEIVRDSEQFIFRCLKAAGGSHGIQLSVCSPSENSLKNCKLQHRVNQGPLNSHQSNKTACPTDSAQTTKNAAKELDIHKDSAPNVNSPTAVLTDFNQNVELRTKPTECECESNGQETLEIDSFRGNGVTCSGSDLSETQLSVDGGSRNIKRGISQVSGSSSTMSGSASYLSRRSHGKSKAGEGKLVKKFSKSSSTDSPERDEMEPLHNHKDPKVDPKYIPNSPQEFSSLPVHRENRALSMADIIIDPDHAHSLPLDDYRPCGQTSCLCASCQGDSPACTNCGVRPGSSQRKPQALPGAQTYIELPPGQLSEEYRTFLLKYPQLAVWDIKTHVVEIDKGSAKEFGFSYKVKVGKNQDASVEIYTLVQSVEKAGPAKGKLNVGDWVRSVNSTPIQIPQDAFALINNSTKDPVLRLVIQRPVGLSQQPNQKDLTEKSPEAMPPFPQSPILSPGTRDSDPLIPSTPIPGIIEPKTQPETKVTTQFIDFHDSPPRHSDELDSSEPPFPRAVKLPKVRLFLCGGEAEKCAKFLLKDSGIDLEFKRPGYTCTDCSMATDCFGNVVISAPCSNLYSTSSQPNSYVMDSCKSGGDVRCRHCGGDYLSASSPASLGTVVNIEMFVVPDDRLFHHCCNYLFTKSSIFILTFDGAKLLGSAPSEFSRLQNLSHTIRSFVGEEAHIMSCGLLSNAGDMKNFTDEVRALFYTPYNSQLQNFNVCGPELINLRGSASSSESFSDNHQLHVILWKVITETIQRQRVIHPALLVIDQLNHVRRKDVFMKEGQLMEVMRTKLPGYQLDVHQMILTYLTMNREILLGKAMPFITSSHNSIESMILLDPRLLMDHLHLAIATVADDKQSWSRTHSTGFIKASFLSDLLTEAGPYKQWLVDFLECCGLVFKKGTDLFLPYFALVPSSTLSPLADRKDWVLYVKFEEHEGSQVFWRLALGLAGRSDSPGSLAVADAHCCSFLHAGLHVTVHHQKVDDRVKFIFTRQDKSSGLRAPELLDWMWAACHHALGPVDVDFQLGAPCPHGDDCRRGSGGLHLVDVRQSRLYCGEDRIDQSKTIRMWRTRDIENISLPSVRSYSGGASSPTAMSPVQSLVKMPVCGTPSPTVLSSNMASPVFPTARSPTNLSQGKSSGKSGGQTKQPVLVMELGWTVFHKICCKLKVHSTLGRDWMGLAGLMGKTSDDVQLLETEAEPSRHLLCDWSRSNNATIEDLISLLQQLEREDIISDIRQHYPPPSPSPADTQPSLSTQPDVPGAVIQDPVTQIGVSEVAVKNVSTGGMVSEEENCVGLSVVYNNLDLNTQTDRLAAGTIDTITPVEIIYQRRDALPDS